jgi:DNA-binding GntR family transcriptional regulator
MRSDDSIPLYKKLFDDLKNQIDNGVFKKGDLLPSENELCKTYSTTRPTVRQALSSLISLGYIVRQHGKGSIVTEPKKGLGILSIKGVTTAVGDNNLRTEIIRKPEKIHWPTDFFFDLSPAEQTAGAIAFARLRFVKDAPILFEETFITNKGIPRFVSRNLENRSLFNTLSEHYNIEVIGGEQKIWAIQADATISKLLQLKKGAPIVHMKRKLSTNVPNLYLYSNLYCNTEAYYLQDYF